MGFLGITTHKHPLYRGYIGISHTSTLVVLQKEAPLVVHRSWTAGTCPSLEVWFRSFPGIFSWVMAVGSSRESSRVVVSEALVFLFQLDAKKETETQKNNWELNKWKMNWWTRIFWNRFLDILFRSPRIVGEMIQFDLRIFFKYVEVTPFTKDALDWCPPRNIAARYPKMTPDLKPGSSIFKVHHVWGSTLVFELFFD